LKRGRRNGSELNGLRFDDDELTNFTDEWHVCDYSALGYSIVRVPVLASEDRLAYIFCTAR